MPRMAKPEFSCAVKVQYLPDQSQPPEGPYAFAYTVTIRNSGDITATARADTDIDLMNSYAGGPVSQVNSIIWPNAAFDNNITVFGPEVKALAGQTAQATTGEPAQTRYLGPAGPQLAAGRRRLGTAGRSSARAALWRRRASGLG